MTACGAVWLLWVHINCTLTISLDNVYLLVDDSTFASTKSKYLEDSRANRLDLQWNAAPALQWIGPSILLLSSTIWCSFWLISAPLLLLFCQKATKETEQKTARLHPSQVAYICGPSNVRGTRPSTYVTHK